MQPSLSRKSNLIRVSRGEKKFSACFGKGCATRFRMGRISENYCYFDDGGDEVTAFSGVQR
jgi:hypothetical protein